ncbi:MerR family transcriptional regulator [Actinokineospora auranticolor]|uniref:Serine/threonine protein phosphatase PrpC n=1 Tax=Actinokineospora auranticolor TaxID=155976 RepID=A0A2S6H196_9PSEU|nr:MerR family transcriptional regulator [Actinokineospora auranticolor]PPK71259.1 serine/threonine protein phosphatase PrpC [Actinokineospora auranticolor]
MGLRTIGAFARATGLTHKALRLYHELGLLPPAAVDPETGYRYYREEQVARARFIASLRGLGMPLAEIGPVSRMSQADAAGAVDAYRRRISSDAAARDRLASSLVAHLSEGSSTMSYLSHATRCDRGAVRESNEDAVFAGTRLLAVADGVRGPGGAAASAAAVDALRPLDRDGDVDPLTALANAAAAAERAVRDLATEDHVPLTTLTAVLVTDDHLALLHVGDSRAYLLRDGELHQLTKDHTHVQTLVDKGDLTPAEAATHPERALLTRAIGAGPRETDLALRTPQPGDRYLLCTDGVSAVLARAEIRQALAESTPDLAAQRLVDLAHDHGAPDNATCVVADLAEV